MKYLSYLILFIFIFCISKIKADSLYVLPSAFYTYGSYSNSNSLNSVSAYLPFFYKQYYLVFGYENIKLVDKNWKYNQENYLLNPIAIFYPFYFKGTYGYIKGNFDYNPEDYKYDDASVIYNFDFIYSINYKYFVGAYYTYIDAKLNQRQGFDSLVFKVKANEVGLRFEYIPHYRVFISIKPTYTQLRVKEKYFGVQTTFNYLLFYNLLISTNFSFGDFKYYFDPDILTFFDQYETQTFKAGAKIEYTFLDNYKLVLSYNHNKFDKYEINYFTVGVRSSFILKF